MKMKFNRKMIKQEEKTKKSFYRLRDKKGIALFVALAGILLMTVLAVEFSREAVIEHRSSAHAVHKLQAYYAAKAGVDISLLRIKLYYKVLSQLGDSLGDNRSLLDQIWQFPFQWPPDLPQDLDPVLRSNIEGAKENSYLKSSYVAVIEREEKKVNLPLLIFSDEKVKQVIQKQILNLFELKKEEDSDFSEKYSDNDLETLVNNIIDWVDEDSESLNGGLESSYYEDKESGSWPAQRLFLSLGEMKLVSGMNEELFLFLKDKVTLYSPPAIQVNFLSKEVFLSVFEEGTEELYEAFSEAKEERGGFPHVESFYSFLESEGYSTDSFKQMPVPLSFDSPSSFRIYSTGLSRGISQSIEAVTISPESFKQGFFNQFKKLYVKEEKEDERRNSNRNSTPPKKEEDSSSKKKTSTIVYWKED